MDLTTATEGDINEMVHEATVAKIKDFCERRVGQGVSREQLNDELKGYVPLINAWAQRQRTMLKLMLLDDDAPTHQLQ